MEVNKTCSSNLGANQNLVNNAGNNSTASNNDNTVSSNTEYFGQIEAKVKEIKKTNGIKLQDFIKLLEECGYEYKSYNGHDKFEDPVLYPYNNAMRK